MPNDHHDSKTTQGYGASYPQTAGSLLISGSVKILIPDSRHRR